MRFEFLLFAAVLFASCNTSSASAISTTLRSLTSKRKDVAAHEVGLMTTKEERGLEFFGLDNIKARVFAMVSKHMEKEQYKNLLADGKDMIDVYKSLKLEEEKNNMQRNARSTAFLKYLADVTNAAPTTTTSNLQLLRRERDEKLLTLFAETREGRYQANLHAGVKSISISLWENERKPPLASFSS